MHNDDLEGVHYAVEGEVRRKHSITIFLAASNSIRWGPAVAPHGQRKLSTSRRVAINECMLS